MNTGTSARPSYYIARDADNPAVIAVYQYVSRGRHPKVATDFATREAAAGWIESEESRTEAIAS